MSQIFCIALHRCKLLDQGIRPYFIFVWFCICIKESCGHAHFRCTQSCIHPLLGSCELSHPYVPATHITCLESLCLYLRFFGITIGLWNLYLENLWFLLAWYNLTFPQVNGNPVSCQCSNSSCGLIKVQFICEWTNKLWPIFGDVF